MNEDFYTKCIYEIEQLRETKNSLNQKTVGACFKAFDMTSFTLRLGNCICIDVSDRTTSIVFYDMNFFFNFDIEDEFPKNYRTFNKNNEENLKKINNNVVYRIR